MLNTTSSLPTGSPANAAIDFECPITLHRMVYPCTTEHGFTFERSAIAKVLAKPGAVCPMSRQPFKSRGVPPVNKRLRHVIERADPAAYYAAKRELERELSTWRKVPAAPPKVPAAPRCICEHLFLLGNPAGRVHARLSRERLREKYEVVQRQFEKAAEDSDLATRARLIGKEAYLKRRLKIADGAARMTRAFDGMLGTYKSRTGELSVGAALRAQPYNRDHELDGELGVVGMSALSAGIAASVCTVGVGAVLFIPAAGLIAQTASLSAAGVKAAIAGASYIPAKLAQRRAEKRFLAANSAS